MPRILVALTKIVLCCVAVMLFSDVLEWAFVSPGEMSIQRRIFQDSVRFEREIAATVAAGATPRKCEQARRKMKALILCKPLHFHGTTIKQRQERLFEPCKIHK